MLSRDSLRVLRGQKYQNYVCPFCLSRGLATRSKIAPTSHRPQRPSLYQTLRPGPSKHKGRTRTFTNAGSLKDAQATSRYAASPLDNGTLPFLPDQFGKSKNVRDYLHQWSVEHQRQLEETAPGEVQRTHGRQLSLPNALFARDNQTPTVQEEVEAEAGDHVENDDLDSSFVGSTKRELKPGDLFFMDSTRVRQQYALYLGHSGYQAQYLLADGRWFVDTQSVWSRYIVRNFATEQEMSAIRTFLPVKPVEISRDASGGTVPMHATGEIPLAAASHILSKIASLSAEVADYKRQHARTLNTLHDVLAHESEFKLLPFENIVQDYFNVDLRSSSEALKLMIIDEFFDNDSLLPLVSRETYQISIMPKRMSRAISTATQWARQYQDAAARAATGKDVSQELQKNPLTSFISKARRLISRSRKIRLPTLDNGISPTIESAVPEDRQVHRIATGEEFSPTDKIIIEFLWLVYIKQPVLWSPATSRHLAVGSLLLRAVGAYPAHRLERRVGRIFLTEIGCLDPWHNLSDYSVTAPLPFLGLNHDARIMNEKQAKALSQLKLNWNGVDIPFPDTMAHLRKDWGNLEVFTIDSPTTNLVDDGISVEPSAEHPGHYWVHIHIAHPSAFLPFNHAFNERARLMGGGFYDPLGNESSMPYEFLRTFSIGPNKPVLTCSTLLAPNGSVKSVEIVPGIVRNVVKIHSDRLASFMGTKSTIVNRLRIGKTKGSAGEEFTDAMEKLSEQAAQQQELLQQYGSTMKLLQKLMVLRWEARYRENPNHLKMRKTPRVKIDLALQMGEPADRSYERIFRSEHCIGDPSITVRASLAQLHENFDDQATKDDLLTTAMILAQESAGLWLRQRDVPGVYRSNMPRGGFDLEKLNNLGANEGFLAPSSTDSTIPYPYVILNAAQMASFTNPLRKYIDLLNHYNIDAYLKANSEATNQSNHEPHDVVYPQSRKELTKYIRENDVYMDISQMSGKSKFHWTFQALFRAFHFNEAKLPEVWDIVVGNPVRIGKHLDADVHINGHLLVFGLQVRLEPSEEGWEKQAKFRQYLPVKLLRVDSHYDLLCVAVGPPSDTPIANGGTCIYPEFTIADE
ncbi:3'-5' RNA exonuclease complex component [Neophaeococcomyces mojaviensis]|uniref:3'-5' RNA exonuclease complex component n=1 Tax=Neophaeococcomyces mojaviensis TaxID=3383035 RepID=A0ACC2ZZR4_9EURO|nr:3'-5' RNA exonuclease complex component [Knufia sp. JES_112]